MLQPSLTHIRQNQLRPLPSHHTPLFSGLLVGSSCSKSTASSEFEEFRFIGMKAMCCPAMWYWSHESNFSPAFARGGGAALPVGSGFVCLCGLGRYSRVWISRSSYSHANDRSECSGALLEGLRLFAKKQDVPYQFLLRIYLAERIQEESCQLEWTD